MPLTCSLSHMTALPRHARRLLCIAAAGMLGSLGAPGAAFAQSQAIPASAAQSSLEQLSQQTQQIYQRVRADVIRVRLPASLWVVQVRQQQQMEIHRFLERWGPDLRPDARQQLLVEEQQLAHPPATRPRPTPPATAPTHTVTLTPVAAALLIDDKGHAMLPLYVDARAAGDPTLSVLFANGQFARARVIGGDAETNLSVLQIQPAESPAGGPAAPLALPPAAVLSPVRPDDGQLVLLLSPEGGGHLILWDDARFDPGMAVMADGSVAGFCFNNQFLAASACRPIVQQLIATGAVHRAVLGVWVREVRRDDPLRQQIAPLGDRRAIYVDQVVHDSLAEHAGIRPGDVIVSAAGQAVEDRATFAAIMATHTGATDLQILRGGDSLTVSVDLRPQ